MVTAEPIDHHTSTFAERSVRHAKYPVTSTSVVAHNVWPLGNDAKWTLPGSCQNSDGGRGRPTQALRIAASSAAAIIEPTTTITLNHWAVRQPQMAPPIATRIGSTTGPK